MFLSCINFCMRPSCLVLLPGSLQELSVAAAVSVEDTSVQLQHLTDLQELQIIWSTPKKITGWATLPQSLTQLDMSGSGTAMLPGALLDLKLDILALSTGVLGQLAMHSEERPQLARLKLVGCVKRSVASLSVAGDTFGDLIQDRKVSSETLGVTCAGLAACTQLTWLGLEHCRVSTSGQQMFEAACLHLQKLQNVKSIDSEPLNRRTVLMFAQRGAAMCKQQAAAAASVDGVMQGG
jgi:hypothetical protein